MGALDTPLRSTVGRRHDHPMNERVRSGTDAAWRWAVREVALPLGDRALRHPMMRRLEFLQRAQWWSAGRVLEARDAALRSLIDVAFREVPFYRSLMMEAGIGPEDVRDASDLGRLPIVDKAMLRSAYPDRTVRSTGFPTYAVSSSGSTGSNFEVMEDTETAGLWRASLLLAFEWSGWRIGDPHLQTGMAPDRRGTRRLKDRLLRCDYMRAYGLHDADLDRALERIRRKSLLHVRGYPASIYYLARRACQTGRRMDLNSVVTWGDNLLPHYRRTITEAFGVPVLDTYGCGEGLQIAAQCDRIDAYHIHELDVIVEIVDDDGARVRAGEPGHVIVTRLHPGPMPLIRYRIGDVGRLGTDPCPCGRGFATLLAVEGRDTEVVLTPSGNRLIVHFFTGILEYFSEIEHFQVVQTELDTIRVRLVATRRFTEQMARDIVTVMKARGAGDMRIEVDVVEEIAISPSGKRRFVVNEYARRLTSSGRTK